MKVTAYVIVDDPVDVQARIVEGWQPWGQPFFGHDGEGRHLFRQAMVIFKPWTVLEVS